MELVDRGSSDIGYCCFPLDPNDLQREGESPDSRTLSGGATSYRVNFDNEDLKLGGTWRGASCANLTGDMLSALEYVKTHFSRILIQHPHN
jgi:hypothetical protein